MSQKALVNFSMQQVFTIIKFFADIQKNNGEIQGAGFSGVLGHGVPRGPFHWRAVTGVWENAGSC